MKKYKVIDLQTNNYFANGETFNDKKEICKELIDLHSIDNDMSEEIELLNKEKIEECWNRISHYFEWELEEIK